MELATISTTTNTAARLQNAINDVFFNLCREVKKYDSLQYLVEPDGLYTIDYFPASKRNDGLSFENAGKGQVIAFDRTKRDQIVNGIRKTFLYQSDLLPSDDEDLINELVATFYQLVGLQKSQNEQQILNALADAKKLVLKAAYRHVPDGIILVNVTNF